MSTHWEQKFESLGAFWVHDGNPARPYARLTSGKISNGFFNCGLLMSEHPRVFADAVRQLARRGGLDGKDAAYRGRVIGAAKGAINLAYQLAEYASLPYAYAEKTEDGLEFEDRFSGYFLKGERFVLCEDTITTGGTVERLIAAARSASRDARFAPCILAVCNRSGQEEVANLPIVALINRHMPAWDEGQNPFTPDGRELVEPVRPKTHWRELTHQYL